MLYSTSHERDVTVITPWYPTPQSPFRGTFVRSMVRATSPGCNSMTVIHCEDLVSPTAPDEEAVLRRASLALAPMVFPVADLWGVEMQRLGIPVRTGSQFGAIARRHAETVRSLYAGPIPSSVIHAHVGLPAGWTALENAAPGARVFLTEHASFLDKVLEQPDSRAMYDEVLDRVDGFFAVGEPVRAPLAAAFPHHADKISLIPNPVPFDRPRTHPVTALQRWLFIGNLIERKGVLLLLQAFAKCHAEDPTLSLSFVGEGPLRQQLADSAAELGITDAITFHGALTPDQTLHAMANHDLLVHPSRLETFGMTIVEAIATGTPVLVTRCGGPQETLAGIETAASEFIDVTDSPDDIANGYRHLRDRFPHELNIPLAQHTLATRYSYPAVGAAHHRIWFPNTTEQAAS